MSKESKLKALIQNHNNSPENEFIDIEKDDEIIYQYMRGAHNVTLMTEKEFDDVLEFLREEGLEVQQSVREEGWLTFRGYKETEQDFELLKKVLSIRNMSIEDIDNAKDNREDEEISWDEI